MNLSNFVHAALAFTIQLSIGLATGNWLYGALVANGIFWGREHAQKQYSIAKQKECSVKDLDWWEGGDMTQWSKDSLLDFATPLALTIVVWLVSVNI